MLRQLLILVSLLLLTLAAAPTGEAAQCSVGDEWTSPDVACYQGEKWCAAYASLYPVSQGRVCAGVEQ